jgi:hypothetical protein
MDIDSTPYQLNKHKRMHTQRVCLSSRTLEISRLYSLKTIGSPNKLIYQSPHSNHNITKALPTRPKTLATTLINKLTSWTNQSQQIGSVQQPTLIKLLRKEAHSPKLNAATGKAQT